MVMWFSPEFARDRGLDETCLRHRAGQYTDHDALFRDRRVQSPKQLVEGAVP
ncbi:hypothetical protein XGA_4985 [Xanthomonas hortorum ATCC 19865]|nr:hypothetical protein XGA_4985 [Xanthomonas hortorum ATCC 19865]